MPERPGSFRRLIRNMRIQHDIDEFLARAHGISIGDGEQLCADCRGSGRYRIRFGHDYCERRDTVACPNCDGKGKHSIGRPRRDMFRILENASRG